MSRGTPLIPIWLALAALPLHLAAAAPRPQAAKPAAESELRIFADEKTYTEEKLFASGHVEIVWEDYRIYAEAIEYNFKSRELFAQGRVTMSSKETVLSGEKLWLNLRSRRGEMTESFGLMNPFLGYETSRLVQKNADTFTFDRLKMTSCAQVVPRWRITCRRGTIKKDRYLEMSDVWFKIKGIPFFYLPYLRYPLDKNGRSTGFLIPNVGHSGQRGTFVLGSFFWAIRSNIDLTLNADYYSQLGLGLGQELRYLFRSASGGFKYFHFRYNDTFRTTPGRSELESGLTRDYYIQGSHRQEFGFLRSRLVAQIHRQSRPDFMRLLSNNFDRSINTNFMSSLQWSSSWRNLSLAAMASRSETYYNELDKSSTLQYMPQVTLRLRQLRIGSLPLYVSLNGQYDDYSRGGVSYDEETQFVTDITSRRLNLQPSLDMPLLKLPFLRFSVNAAAQFIRYDKRRNPLSGEVETEPIWANTRTVEATLQGPTFFRLFQSRHARFKHVIEPSFRARYASKVANSDELVAIDRLDRPSYSYAGMTLTSRLFVKSYPYKGSPREVLTYSIGQEYYFDPKEANFYQPVNGEYPKLSVLTQSLRARPLDGLSLDASFDLHHTLHLFTRASLGVELRRKNVPLAGRFYLNSYHSPYNSSVIFNRTLIGGSLDFDAPGFPVKLNSGLDYDFKAHEFRNAFVRATLDYQCVTVMGEFKVITRFISGKLATDPMFRVSVSLGNLGMVSDLFGGKR